MIEYTLSILSVVFCIRTVFSMVDPVIMCAIALLICGIKYNKNSRWNKIHKIRGGSIYI